MATPIELLDRVYGELTDLADSGEVTQQERGMLLNAAADVRFRKNALEMIAEERERRGITFGPAGAVLAV